MNGEQLLVMSVVIELWSGQGPRVVGDEIHIQDSASTYEEQENAETTK